MHRGGRYEFSNGQSNTTAALLYLSLSLSFFFRSGTDDSDDSFISSFGCTVHGRLNHDTRGTNREFTPVLYVGSSRGESVIFPVELQLGSQNTFRGYFRVPSLHLHKIISYSSYFGNDTRGLRPSRSPGKKFGPEIVTTPEFRCCGEKLT